VVLDLPDGVDESGEGGGVGGDGVHRV